MHSVSCQVMPNVLFVCDTCPLLYEYACMCVLLVCLTTHTYDPRSCQNDLLVTSLLGAIQKIRLLCAVSYLMFVSVCIQTKHSAMVPE